MHGYPRRSQFAHEGFIPSHFNFRPNYKGSTSYYELANEERSFTSTKLTRHRRSLGSAWAMEWREEVKLKHSQVNRPIYWKNSLVLRYYSFEKTWMSDWFEGSNSYLSFIRLETELRLTTTFRNLPPTILNNERDPAHLVEWSLKLSWNREWFGCFDKCVDLIFLFRPFRTTLACWRLILFQIGSPISSTCSSRNPGYIGLKAVISQWGMHLIQKFPPWYLFPLALSMKIKRPSWSKYYWPWNFPFAKTKRRRCPEEVNK